MRNVVYSMMVSLDGFIEGADPEQDWATVDEELHGFVNDLQAQFDTHLYGRRVYEAMAGYWNTAGDNPSAPVIEQDFSRIWTQLQKIVFSKTLATVEGNAQIVREVDAAEVNRWKAEPGKDMALAGANLAARFWELDLVDELQMVVHPVLLGGGRRMLPPLEGMRRLELLETRRFSSGVVYVRYQVTK